MDNVLKNIKRFFNIIYGINKLVIPYIKKAIKKTKENGVDTNKIITDFTNDLISKVEIKIIEPIKEFINCVFGKNDKLEKYKLYENVISLGYQKIRKIGIENYEKGKNYVSQKYDEIKESYLNKRKEICELPEQLEKKFIEKKENIIQEYEKIKKDIIESTDEKINQLQNLNLTTKFREYFSFFKDIINKNLNDIKEKTKTKIYELTNIIPDFIDYIDTIIDEILNLDFGNFSEDKINISEHIMNFISEVLSDNIQLQYKNENDEIIDKNIKEELIKYLNENLNIEAKNIRDIIEHLFKNGLKSILINHINQFNNKIFTFTQNKIEPIKQMIKGYFNIFKGNISDFFNIVNDKIKEKINYFDYFIKFINQLLQNKNICQFYYTIEEHILINEDFKNLLLEELKELKNKLINNLANEMEKKIEELYEKMKEMLEAKGYKEKATKKINEIVDKTENKIFGYINDILIEEKEGKDKNIENEENIKEEKELKTDKEEKELKTKKEEKKEKEEKKSEFEKFDKNFIKIIDKKITTKASEIENKIINFAKNLDEQAKDYLVMKFSDKIEKKKIDDLFNYVNKFKEKKKKFLESENIKSNCKRLDNTLTQIANSQALDKTINFIEGINPKSIKDFLDEVSLISPMLESKNKEEFKNECKKFIREEICKCYEIILKPKLKKIVIKICEDIIEAIDKKINKK